jgi:hypothetical protein
MRLKRLIRGAALTFAYALSLTACAPQPEEEPSSTSSAPAAMTPVLSIRELMRHIIDPMADEVFDAAVVDVSTSGTTTTVPVSDDDWVKVELGLLTLAETSNLLKMQRRVAPVGEAEESSAPGVPAPELSPLEIQAKIDQDRVRWNQFADDLRTVALASLPVVKARDPEAIFKVGGDIDDACEACHLEFWYPGDKPIVLRNRNSTVTVAPPKK